MKNFYIFILLLGISFPTDAWSQASRTLVKSLPLDAAVAVVFDAPGQVQTTIWEKDFIRVNTIITTPNFGDEYLKRLVSLGRYRLETEVKDGRLYVRMPKIAHTVSIKGEQIIEQLRYEISLPEGLDIEFAQQPSL